MSRYLGKYQHQIDEKGRLSLPASYRREKGEQTLVLVHVFPDNLTLFPEDTWAEVEARLGEAMRGSASARAWALGVTSNANEVTPDKQGRILVPQRMQDAVGIKGATLVVGALNKVELWDPERFEATTRAAEQPEDITNQIFA